MVEDCTTLNFCLHNVTGLDPGPDYEIYNSVKLLIAKLTAYQKYEVFTSIKAPTTVSSLLPQHLSSTLPPAKPMLAPPHPPASLPPSVSLPDA